MKAQPLRADDDGIYHNCEPEEATHLMLDLPGPMRVRVLGVVLSGSRDKATERRREPVWSWNGSVDAPTVRPSILTKGIGVCHSFVNDGKVQFLNDCTHEHAGKTMDLLDVDTEFYSGT